MRWLVVIAGFAGCTAITDFSQFQNGPSDLAYTSAMFAQTCDPTQAMPCVPGQSAPTRPLICFSSLAGHPVEGGICTRECIGLTACGDYGMFNTCASVGTIAQPNYCMPLCNLPTAPCRRGLNCCANGAAIDTGVGTCLPNCKHD